MKQPDVDFGYRHQAPWTQKTRDTRCMGDDRTFDKIVAASVAKERYETDRERKLKDYFMQPQRGTMRGNKMNDGAIGSTIQAGGDILITQNEQPSKIQGQSTNAGQATKA